MKMSVMAFALVLGSSLSAFADQCAVLTGQQALDAARIIARQPHMYEYCEACGDQFASKVPASRVQARIFSVDTTTTVAIARAGNVIAAAISQDLSVSLELLVGGQGVDLAYLYDARGTNIGQRVGCWNSSPEVLPGH